MTFEGQYLTYLEYKGIIQSIGGSPMEEMPFNLLEFESRRQIDIRTQNRLKDINSENIPQEVKLCMYNLIGTINNYASSIQSATEGGNIASESTDGYSVTYVKSAQIKEIIQSKSVEINDIIRTYLLGVTFSQQHLMYLGVD